MDNLIFLIMDILLLVWSITELNNWLVHPQESIERMTKVLRTARKIFFFLPFFPFGFYERNPEYMIRRYRVSLVLMTIIFIIGFILAIISMLGMLRGK